MTRTQTGAIVAMEVLVEKNQIAPVGIRLKFFRSAIDRPVACGIAEEDSGEPVAQLLCNLEQCHPFSRTGRALHFELVSEVGIHLEQSPNDERVHRHPDGTTPIGIASKQA